MDIKPALYLLPVNISDAPFSEVLPSYNISIIREIKNYIVENVRTARRFLKKCDPGIDISEITFYELNGHTDDSEVYAYLDPLRGGNPMGLMSEAGCPGVADPGALAVRIAQSEQFKVIPLVGPSSIILALMASGLNGQRFSFNGYLPVETGERERKIRELENRSQREDMTQIFIETPYRNEKMMESLLKTLKPDTLLCVARAVTDPEHEKIITKSVAKWRLDKFEAGKYPTIFLFYSLIHSRGK